MNNPNVFCYICGSYVIARQRQDINSFVKNVYYAYLGVRLGDKTKAGHRTRYAVHVLRD